MTSRIMAKVVSVVANIVVTDAVCAVVVAIDRISLVVVAVSVEETSLVA